MANMTNSKGRGWYFMPVLLIVVFLGCSFLGGIGYFEMSSPEKTCVSCHEIQVSHDSWTNSAHRNVSCKECHGGSADSWHALKENGKRVFYHLKDKRHDDIRLSEEQVLRMVNNCAECHARQYEHWKKGGHGISYAGIFLDEKHNKTEQMAEDCMRCHAMFNENSVAGVVAPLNIKGPWRLLDPKMADQPTIPCMACHNLHAKGRPFERRDKSVQGAGGCTNAPCVRHDAVAFYVRQEKMSFPIDDLMVPRIVEGERIVKVSRDPRQRLCTQCHAPNAMGEAGSSDDRTPTGVHEGISCAACHKPHSNDTRGSCVSCHPRFSTCGLDVMKMDTTYRSSKSRNDIHRMKCIDCHKDGVPKRNAKR